MTASKSDIIRRLFEAYRLKDRSLLDGLLADDFRFTSPYDDAIDKAAYFERCWPASVRIRDNTVERIFEQDDNAFVTYRCTAADGRIFRNTEFFLFENGQVKSVDVYFGATYKDGAFVRQAS
jgi:ketosteroid isomerase-like protein